MAYQRRTRLTVGDRVKGCQAVLFGQGPNGFLAAKDAAIKPKDLEGKDRETGAKFVVKDTFSVVQKRFLLQLKWVSTSKDARMTKSR